VATMSVYLPRTEGWVSMTEPPRARATTADDRAPGLPVPASDGPPGLGRRVMSPRALLAVDTSVGLGVALFAGAALLQIGVF